MRRSLIAINFPFSFRSNVDAYADLQELATRLQMERRLQLTNSSSQYSLCYEDDDMSQRDSVLSISLLQMLFTSHPQRGSHDQDSWTCYRYFIIPNPHYGIGIGIGIVVSQSVTYLYHSFFNPLNNSTKCVPKIHRPFLAHCPVPVDPILHLCGITPEFVLTCKACCSRRNHED